MKLILDISANTTKNDDKYAKRMIDNIKKIDHKKYDIIFKAQLFESAALNIAMDKLHFDYIYNYCKKLGYQCTASVFDILSLNFLMSYDVPFIKIANNKNLYYLIDYIPRKYNVLVSIDTPIYIEGYKGIETLFCVSKYPAIIQDYKDFKHFSRHYNINGISDHTTDLTFFNTSLESIIYYEHKYFEMHYALPDSTGLDVDANICKTPNMLKEIL